MISMPPIKPGPSQSAFQAVSSGEIKQVESFLKTGEANYSASERKPDIGGNGIKVDSAESVPSLYHKQVL